VKTPVLPALLLAAALCDDASGDTVKLKNGDSLTGAVVHILDGKLTLKTDAAGDVVIDLAQVATFSTDVSITVELADGTLHAGKASFGDDGTVRFEAETFAGETLVITDLASVNRPPKAPQEWTGSIVGASTWVRGNTHSQATALDANASLRRDEDRISLAAWYRAARQRDRSTGNESTTERRFGASGKYDYFFPDSKAYAYVNLSGERDDIAAVDFRFVAGAGLGNQFIEDDHTKLSAEAGLALFHENYAGPTDDVSAISLRAAGKFDHRFNEAHTTFAEAELYKVFEDWNDYFVRARAGFRQQITGSFFAQEWVDWNWDPTPAAGKERVDVIYYAGVGWNF
jgi:putative salt-induced outer membrane protein YdiY